MPLNSGPLRRRAKLENVKTRGGIGLRTGCYKRRFRILRSWALATGVEKSPLDEAKKTMKKLYSAQDLLMLGHLKSVLEARGIDCVLRNMHLTAAMGELPPIECWPELWVCEDEQYGAAQAVLTRAFAPLKSVQKSWQCGHCGEVIEGQFLECWNCGSSRSRPPTPDEGD
jgi:Putative prokaryotic signal transducing protein